MPQGFIREKSDMQHPEKLKVPQGHEIVGNVESGEILETGEATEQALPASRETAVGKSVPGEEQTISKDLQEVRKIINQTENKSDTVVHQQLVADILNGKVDPVNLEKKGSAFDIKQSMIEEAKKNADNSRN